MYKALGIALVFLSLGILTYKKVEAKREHLINLKEFRKALLVLKNEMSFSIPEVPLLCEKVSSQTVGEISSVFKNIGKIVSNDSGITFLEAWNEATKEKELFTARAEKEVLDFLKGFGKKTLEIELESIKRTQNVLDIMTEEENDIFQRDKKLTYALGTAVGLVIVILTI